MKSAAVFGGLLASAGAVATLNRGVEVIPGRYIIRLKDGFNGEMIKNHANKLTSKFGGDVVLGHVYDALAEHGYSGYAAALSPEALDFLLNLEEVLEIEEDQIGRISACTDTQSNPVWGLTRTNQRGSYKAAPYYYTDNATGKNVDIYVIDTGIYCANVEFSKSVGTCTQGIDYVDGTGVDGNGHGTHVAGTAGGKTYGVAKEANLIAVRVLGDDGGGSYSDIIAGVNWVVTNYQKTKRPSLSNLSLGGSTSSQLNSAVNSAVSANVAQIVAAGNSNQNACNYSPASAASAVTVGATDKTDTRASYSNYGNCLDIFGPGSSITSAWIGSTTATKTIDGTSMASPHVAGVAAKFLSANPSLTATALSNQLISTATLNVIKNESGGSSANPSNTSPDRMVYGYCT